MNAATAQVRDKLLEHGQVLKQKEQKFTPSEAADKLNLRKYWGHLNIYKIAAMGDEQLYQTFVRLPQLPCFWPTAARRIRNACQLIVDRYQGEPRSMCDNNPKAGDLQARLEQFDGIGQKKASMAVNTLARDLDVPVRAWDEIDVSYDIQVSRVFQRAGLCDVNTQEAVIRAARRLNTDYPGALDLPCWDIGRRWCYPQNPYCGKCYILSLCPKRL